LEQVFITGFTITQLKVIAEKLPPRELVPMPRSFPELDDNSIRSRV
jgi:hypothetical protein